MNVRPVLSETYKFKIKDIIALSNNKYYKLLDEFIF